MKNQFLLLPILALLFFSELKSQCVSVNLVNTSGTACGPTPQTLTFFAAINVTCPDAMSMMVFYQDDNGYQNFTTSNFDQPIFLTITTLPYGIAPSYGMVNVTVFDAANLAIGTADASVADIWQLLNPVWVCESGSTTSCQGQCFSQHVCAGTAPYTIDWNDGEVSSSYQTTQWHCYSEQGAYHPLVVDANSCGSQSWTIEVSEVMPTGPYACEVAEQLYNGVALTDSICSNNPNIDSCAGYPDLNNAWYHINSGDNSHLTFGVVPGTDVWAVTVYTSATPGDCSNLQEVYCTGVYNDTECFDLAEYITIEPNTEYYFKYAAIDAYQIIHMVAVLSNETINPICGCMDPTSCDYNPDALVGAYWNCATAGCLDPAACNFLPWAGCDDGSCLYGENLNVQLFYDTNGDGIMTYNEYGVGNIGFITITETGDIVYPNAEGQITIPELPFGQYNISYTDPNGQWELSPGAVTTSTLPTCNGLKIGLVNTNTDAQFGIYVVSSPFMSCTNGTIPGIFLYNTGSVALNGTVTLTYNNDLLSISPFDFAAPISSNNNGMITWNFPNQQPGTIGLYYTHVDGPGPDFVGQSFNFTITLTLYDNNNQLVYSGQWQQNPVVSCSYDPNEKTAVPQGYATPHYILADQEIEYTIHFQNTGNAPAELVRIEDQIDVTHLDLSTFHPIGASHLYNTIVHPDGQVEFVFNNIDLPDSTSDPINSQGFVVYAIKPLSSLSGGEEIHNTANIYFDSNPAIVTNTTTHTIYNCAWLSTPIASSEMCAGTYEVTDEGILYAEEHTWTVNGEVQPGNGPTFTSNFETAGDYVIGMTRSNPLCSVTTNYTVTVHEQPNIEIALDINTGFITGPAGYTYAWYQYNELLPGENQNTLNTGQFDGYEVYAVVTNEWGCTGTTNTLIADNIINESSFNVELFPNPADDMTTLRLPGGNYRVSVFNAIGQKVNEWNNVRSSMNLDTSNWNAGNYWIHVSDESGQSAKIALAVR